MGPVEEPFRPALIVVDLQEDFCPPDGSLAVADGRAVVPVINKLLSYPAFTTRVATQDWHPPNHVSFASNHEGTPKKKPFVDTVTITNPLNRHEKYETRLWPVHCVRGTKGAKLLPELDASRIDFFIKKGIDSRVETYSAFYDPLKNPRVCDSGLADMLRNRQATHIYVVGLAADYCVKSTALDAAAEGFVTYIIREATRAVEPKGWEEGIDADKVTIVSFDGPEVMRLKESPDDY